MKTVIYGAHSDYLFDVMDSIERLGWSVEAVVSNLPDLAPPQGLVVHSISEIKNEWLQLSVVVPQITPGFRAKMYEQLRQLGFTDFCSVIDPNAVISKRAHVGEGVLANVFSVVAANAQIGNFCVLNRSTSVGHDAVLEPYVTIGPGATVCGSVFIGSGSFVGAGAIINPKLSIGRNCVIGAGAVVTRDVPDRCKVLGNPAKVSQTEVLGYNNSLVPA